MNRRELLIKTAIAVTSYGVYANSLQAKEAEKNDTSSTLLGQLMSHHNPEWIMLAEKLKPELVRRKVPASNIVHGVTDAGSVLKYKMMADVKNTLKTISEKPLHSGDSIIVDFSHHLTGFLSFDLDWAGRGNDAPTRLRLVFGEVPGDVMERLYPYTGTLSASWLPDEIINVDHLPAHVSIPRRHAYQYVKIEIISTSKNFGVMFRNIQTTAVSSAGKDKIKPSSTLSPRWQKIEDISLRTLHECMQTTFEDGPRRDQRLWLGDLRLQALTNYVSFQQNDLVKRCLYLFAGLCNSEGLITACVYEKPTPSAGEGVMLDYAALFGPTLADYWQATGDEKTMKELLPVAIRQLSLLAERYVDKEGLFQVPERPFTFIDWQDGLDKQGSMHGVMIYCCKSVSIMAKHVADERTCIYLNALAEQMSQAAREHLWLSDKKVFISGPNQQISWATQIWMVLAGVIDGKNGSELLRRVMANPQATQPLTPYLYHHLVSAFIATGDKDSARKVILDYWGVMSEQGADTFWEAFNPSDPEASPYGSAQINSYCHAWSCTPAYFIRQDFSKP